MRPFSRLLIAAAMLVPSAALAEPAPALPSEVRLSDAEKEKVLEAAATRNRVPPATEAGSAEDSGEGAPPIHGEVGFAIGTGGYRSAYGTAVVPLQESGVAIISLGTTDFGDRRYVEPWWR